MTEVNEKEAFSAGYEAGWKARSEYSRDYRKAQSGTSFGLALMLIGVTCVICIIIAAFVYAPPISKVVAPLLIFGVPTVAGYFIDKLETNSYNKRLAEFKEKWGND